MQKVNNYYKRRTIQYELKKMKFKKRMCMEITFCKFLTIKEGSVLGYQIKAKTTNCIYKCSTYHMNYVFTHLFLYFSINMKINLNFIFEYRFDEN